MLRSVVNFRMLLIWLRVITLIGNQKQKVPGIKLKRKKLKVHKDRMETVSEMEQRLKGNIMYSQ